MPVCSLGKVTTLDPDWRSTTDGEPGAIFRYRITLRHPFTNALTSSVSTVPACPASTVRRLAARGGGVFKVA